MFYLSVKLALSTLGIIRCRQNLKRDPSPSVKRRYYVTLPCAESLLDAFHTNRNIDFALKIIFNRKTQKTSPFHKEELISRSKDRIRDCWETHAAFHLLVGCRRRKPESTLARMDKEDQTGRKEERRGVERERGGRGHEVRTLT